MEGDHASAVKSRESHNVLSRESIDLHKGATVSEKPLSKGINKPNIDGEPAPLAISTPRNAKSAEYNSRIHSHHKESLQSQREKTSRMASVEEIQSRYSAAPVRSTEKDSMQRKQRDVGNLRSSNLQESRQKDTAYSSRSVRIDPRPPMEYSRPSLTSISTAAPIVSKTKEVVEIKNRNSAEIDPSKSFKPINPDEEITNKTETSTSRYQPSYTSTSYAASKPYTFSSHKYYPLSTTESTYSRPYRSKYEPSIYKSKHSLSDTKSIGDDYKNISADSAYGSPSRSFSKAPSVASYTSSYHKDYGLPSLLSTTTATRYPAADDSKESLTKVPPLFRSQHLITA